MLGCDWWTDGSIVPLFGQSLKQLFNIMVVLGEREIFSEVVLDVKRLRTTALVYSLAPLSFDFLATFVVATFTPLYYLYLEIKTDTFYVKMLHFYFYITPRRLQPGFSLLPQGYRYNSSV